MAEKKQSKSPSRSQEREGKREGFPVREPRGGTRRHHDRLLTPSESAAREERRAKARQEELERQEKERKDREPEGWAGRRRER